jgi:phospholipase C
MTATPTRRDVLKAAAIAGAGLSAGVVPERLLQALAAPAVCGTLTDIQHIVVFVQENRSFDHYFGRYKGVRGYDDRTAPGGAALFSQAYPPPVTPTGFSNPLQPFHIDTAVSIPPHQGQCVNDIEHQWCGTHLSWHGGANDSWMKSHLLSEPDAGHAAVTMGYLDRRDLPFYYALADNFTICDNYFCSVIGGTDQNRLMSMTGSLDPDCWDGGGQFFDTQIGTVASPGSDLGVAQKWKPYPQVLQEAGISWKVYGTPDSQLGDNVLRYFPQFRPLVGDVAVPGLDGPLAVNAFSSNAFPLDFALDCVTGSLPQVSWILANLPDTEHAPSPSEWGEDITHKVLVALTESGLWQNTVLLMTYDENGGFFDHVPPPVPPPKPAGDTLGEYYDTTKLGTQALADAKSVANMDTAAQPIGLGFRVPTMVISPFSRNATPGGGPLVSSDLFDHTSMLRFIETWSIGIGKPAVIPNRDVASKRPGLSAWRRGLVGDLTSALNLAGGRDASVPAILLNPALVPNRADPRVLTECVSTLTPFSLIAQTEALPTPYPVPATNTMPTQEALPGPVHRPSGPVSGQASCTPTTRPGASAVPVVAGHLPSTAPGGPGPGLPVAAASLVGGAALVAGWWADRVRRNRAAEGGDAG